MKICVVHFQPVEKYPPVMNLVNYWQENHSQINFKVLSTAGTNQTKNIDQSKVLRLVDFASRSIRLMRMFKYLLFHLKMIVVLIKFRPEAIVYFETISSAGVWCYKNIFNPGLRVFVHYHEYTSPRELQQGMLLNKWFHLIERRNYHRAEQISHTNRERLNLFLADEKLIRTSRLSIIPNYPPARWRTLARKVNQFSVPWKFVYVGAVNNESMFLKETIEFFSSHKELILDIYSNNITSKSVDLIKGYNGNNVNLKGSLDYFDLPEVLKNYHVGLIIYRGTTENYIYNAPNKLFEYLACGLDVWVSEEMKGVQPYYSYDKRPLVLPVNFKREGSMIEAMSLGTIELTESDKGYYCETVLGPLTKKLIYGQVQPALSASEF